MLDHGSRTQVIDINEGTLDGKNTFHATQYADRQRGFAMLSHLINIV